MNEQNTQSAPNSGASNASDFQPPTQNPQSIPGNVVQQQNSLQGVKNPQEFFNDSQNTTIKVTTEPAPARAAVQPTNDAATLAILLVVAIIAAFAMFKITNRMRRNKIAPSTTELIETTNVESTQDSQEISKPIKSSKPKKKAVGKKTAKKNKRQRR